MAYHEVEVFRLMSRQPHWPGYAPGSAGERVPTEAAVIKITREYKEIGLS